MNIFSYRGPQKDKSGKVKAGGGVSAGLTMIWQNEGAGWYYFDGNDFCFLAPHASDPVILGSFTKKEIDDHYGLLQSRPLAAQTRTCSQNRVSS